MDSTLPLSGTNQTPTIRDESTSFEKALVQSLDLDNWVTGSNLAELYLRIGEDIIKSAVENEAKVDKIIRSELFPKLIKSLDFIDPAIAHQQFTPEIIEKAHLGLLFNGATEASDGTLITHDTLPLTITQIGVCLVSYQGEQGSYAHRLYRKDLQIQGEGSLNEVIQLLEARRSNGTTDGSDDGSLANTSKLAQRALMSYAERAILMEKSKAIWRMGHGNPIPYELLTGFWASKPELTNSALSLFKRIIDHEKFVFVPSATSQRELLAIGNALQPYEYIIVDTLTNHLNRIIDNGGASKKIVEQQKQFVSEYGDKVVLGLYKASPIAPAYVFYAHKNYLQSAALIAMADSVLQEHRGFPMLIDIADNICSATFNPETFFSSIRNAYADAGQPFKYLSERETRNR
jgi:hypothetical protein